MQEVRWRDVRAGNPATYSTHRSTAYDSREALELLEHEGPKYQYGRGCRSDGVLGAWMAEVCGVGETLDPARVRSHLEAVFRYNFRADLRDHSNPQRPMLSAPRAACSSAPGPRVGSPRFRSSTATRCGPASSTRPLPT